MAKKIFAVLGNHSFFLHSSYQLTARSENNPEVMNHLAYQLGFSQDLAFYDVYSLHDPDLLAFIHRPVYALLAIIPLTDAWEKSRIAEDAANKMYSNERLYKTANRRSVRRDGSTLRCVFEGKRWSFMGLEGTRKGLLERGPLGENEDALSQRAVELGLGSLINMQRAQGGDVRFSYIALAPSLG
jgi:Ubiquitin carboxyl-terminal hydrolase, family 1